MSLDSWYCENINKWWYGTWGNNQYRNLQAKVYFEATRFCIVTCFTWPASIPEVCRLRTVQLVLELCSVWALTWLGIRQSDWWRAGIRSTNLHIVVEFVLYGDKVALVVIFSTASTIDGTGLIDITDRYSDVTVVVNADVRDSTVDSLQLRRQQRNGMSSFWRKTFVTGRTGRYQNDNIQQ